MGTTYGKGKQISKENFLRKYGGDAALLATRILTSIIIDAAF